MIVRCLGLVGVSAMALVLCSSGLAAAEPQSFGPFVVDAGDPSVIRLKGEIGVRDSLQFRRALRAAPQARTLLLDSPGGSLIIALDMAEDVLERGLATRVPEGAQCLSACAFVFFAGKERRVEGKLGVHQVASTSSGDVGFTQSTLSDVLDLLRRADVDPEIMQIMLATPPEGMHVFDENEIVRLAIDRDGRAPDVPTPTGPRTDPDDQPQGPVSVETSQLIHVCDELAAPPSDPQKPPSIAGVAFEKIEASQAISACQAALAAAPDEPRLQFELGRSFHAATRYSDALEWYRKAAAQNYAPAQFGLFVFYANGFGVAKDEAEASRLVRQAAELGYAPAQFTLAVRYATGSGVTQDDAEAARWYRKAADQGLALAQFNLAGKYDIGLGVTKDQAEAIRWYRKAADQGFADAQFNLALMYEKGRGVAADEAEAARWFRKAADQGDKGAEAALKRLGKL